MSRRRRAPEPSASARARAAAPPTVQVRTEANLWEAEEAGVEPTEDACAPSNGFEARAPHRERYSSTLILLRFRRCSQRRFGKTRNFCQKSPSSVQPRAGNGIDQRECRTGKSLIGSRNSG